MPQPKVSICMPVYAPRPEHLRAAIMSAQAQTETLWTLRIREDPSEVNTAGIVAPFLSDPRITFERNPQRLGIGGNWNACLREADAPYVQYLFQDDLWNPHYLRQAITALDENPGAGIAAAHHRYLYEGDADTAIYDEVLEARAAYLTPGAHRGKTFLLEWMERGLRPNVIGEPSFVLIRRATIDRAGMFDETMPQFLDVEMWTRCLQHGDLLVLPDDGGSFRVHPDGASAVNAAAGNGLFDRLTAMGRVADSLQDPAEKQRAKKAIGDAIVPMIRKFLRRRKEGKAVGMGGGSGMKAFALKHPWMMLKALLKAIKE